MDPTTSYQCRVVFAINGINVACGTLGDRLVIFKEILELDEKFLEFEVIGDHLIYHAFGDVDNIGT